MKVNKMIAQPAKSKMPAQMVPKMISKKPTMTARMNTLIGGAPKVVAKPMPKPAMPNKKYPGAQPGFRQFGDKGYKPSNGKGVGI